MFFSYKIHIINDPSLFLMSESGSPVFFLKLQSLSKTLSIHVGLSAEQLQVTIIMTMNLLADIFFGVQKVDVWGPSGSVLDSFFDIHF